MAKLKDGTEAQIGDRVRGCGLEGIVSKVGDDDGAQCGMLAVAVLRVAEDDYHGVSWVLRPDGPRLAIDTEYGAAGDFEKVG